ncbi:MAG: redoxin domain-containing protein [Candidatus Sumerlaeota bacterium]|nr:redoxin domain-containing protein [Candidatus Sumerlaeota bacterium]
MRPVFFLMILAGFITTAPAQDLATLKVRDEATTFPAVEALILENGNVYLGEKALGTLFGASLKTEGENLVILCKETLCQPFYKDDPQHTVVLRKAKPMLLASKVGEAFGYVRFAFDKKSGEIRYYKTPEPPIDAPHPIPMPDLTLPSTSGEKVSLSKYNGKKLFILCWAPWDKGRDDLVQWNRLAGELAEKGMQLLLVAQTMEGRERLEPFLSILKPRPVCLVDSGFRFTFLFHLKELPALILVDEKGNLVWGPAKPDLRNDAFRAEISSWVEGGKESKIITAGPTIKEIEPPAMVEEKAARLDLSHALLGAGKRDEAMEEYRRAIGKLSDHVIFSGQLMALKEPERFYPTPTPRPTPTSKPE